jgi:hypothetical protein
MTELVRIPSPYLQRQAAMAADPAWHAYTTSEMSKYPYAYTTADGRWLIERAYGACGGGWRVTDTTGEYHCTSCRDGGGHVSIEPTLDAAKAFVAEWAVGQRVDL